MALLLDLLTLPLLGGPRSVHWLARTIAREAERQFLDEGPVRAELLRLQQRLDAGEIAESEYDQQEKVLLQHLNVIRQLKARNAGQA